MRDPWEKLKDQINIPIVKDFPFRFTRRWFVLRNQTTFSTFLTKRFPPNKPYKGIQIGIFEGMDLIWQMQNIYKHPNSSVIACDPWEKTEKLGSDFMSEVEERARHNLSKWRSQILILKGYSQEILPSLAEGEAGTFDLIIVDGDHNADVVYQDAINAFNLAKPGAWIIFDDVRNRIPKKDHVAKGLECFLEDYDGRAQRIWQHRFCDCVTKL